MADGNKSKEQLLLELSEAKERLVELEQKDIRENPDTKTNNIFTEAANISDDEIFRTVINTAIDSIFCKDLERRYTMVNPAMEMLLGLPAEKIIGNRAEDIFDNDSAPAITEADDPAYKGQEVSGEWTISIGGYPHTFQVIEVPIFNENEDILGVCGIVRDISEIKKTEAALCETVESARLQYMNIPVPTYTWKKEGPDFILADFNNAAIKITKGTVINSLGAELSDFHKQNKDIQEDIRKCYKEKRSFSKEVSYRFLSTGEYKYLSVYYAFLEPDKVIAHTEDITEKKVAEKERNEAYAQMENMVEERTAQLKRANENLKKEIKSREQLERSLQMMRFSVYHAADMVLWFAQDGRITFSNMAACRAMGYTNNEFLSLNIFDIDPSSSRSSWARFWYQVKKRGAFLYESQFRTKSKKEIPVEITVNFVDFIGREYICAFARDITDRKQAESQLMALAQTDPLTNVLNRRHGLKVLRNRIKNAKVRDSKLTISFTDLDDLKKINDSYGHIEGDEALKILAAELTKGLRSGDRVCRFGGDEFLIILPDCTIKRAREIWQRITQALDLVSDEAKKPYKINISSGFAEFDPKSPMSLEQLLATADALMYRHKKSKAQKPDPA